jgi:four helix bundle protein
MNRNDMKDRTKQFALRIIRLSKAMPRNREADVLARQILKSGTSIGANYREAIRASSSRHFVTNLEICLREGEETIYWLELIGESEVMPLKRLTELVDECSQLLAILTATVRTSKRNANMAKTKVIAK